MNYISEINAFERWLEVNYLPCSAQLLWYKLIMLCNRAGWSEWIKVDNQRLMGFIQVKREKTFIDIRNKLIEAGLIDYRKGKKGNPGQYKINTFKLKVQTEVNTEVNTEVQTEVQTEDIYKHRLKQINKENIKRKFVPPSLEEIKKYIQKKKLNVDAIKFYDYFSEGNWVDSKGNKVKNWKQKLLTWNKFSTSQKEQPQMYHDESGQFEDLGKYYANL